MNTPDRPQPDADPSCWCCGRRYPDDELTRLGQHPEVGVCLSCAIWLKRRAVARRDAQRPSSAGRVRAGVRSVRQVVIGRGWHERGRLGALLRRIDRYLP